MKRFAFLAVLTLVFAASAFADCSTLTFQTESGPALFVNEPANFQFEAVGGTPPYKFEVLEEYGALPEGLVLTPSGRLVGVPREESFGTTVIIRLTDAEGCVVNQAFNLQIFGPNTM